MSEPALKISHLRQVIAAVTAGIFCNFVVSAQAQAPLAAQPHASYTHFHTTKHISKAHLKATSAIGLQIIHKPLLKKDRLLASRTSPYQKIKLSHQKEVLVLKDPENDVPLPEARGDLDLSARGTLRTAAVESPAVDRNVVFYNPAITRNRPAITASAPAVVAVITPPPSVPAPPVVTVASNKPIIVPAEKTSAPAVVSAAPARPSSPLLASRMPPVWFVSVNHHHATPPATFVAAAPTQVKTHPETVTPVVSQVAATSTSVPDTAFAANAGAGQTKQMLDNSNMALSRAVVAEATNTQLVIKAGKVDMVSAFIVAQQSTNKAALAAAATAGNIQMAAADTHSLTTLAPAAGGNNSLMAAQPVPGGPITPVPTLDLPPEVAPLPSTHVAVPAMPPASEVPTPEAISPESISEHPQHLSRQSKAIADRLPPEKPKHDNKGPVKLEHFQKNPLESEEVREHQGVGISISVHRPKQDIAHMLEEAYDALIAGNQEDAITIYKQVLAEQPDNKLALFGLATTYHRAGQLQLARPLYGRLLAIDPNNAEGLNNFLVLLGDESPVEALEEMKKLERTHPDFSPLPAQMAVIYDKMGDSDAAIKSMKQAIDLSPENIKYRYDMAIMLDRQGDWEDAAFYYMQLLTAEERGEKIPAKAEEIQERLTFIRSNRPRS